MQTHSVRIDAKKEDSLFPFLLDLVVADPLAHDGDDCIAGGYGDDTAVIRDECVPAIRPHLMLSRHEQDERVPNLELQHLLIRTRLHA